MRRIGLPVLATLAVAAGLLAQPAAAPYALWLANGAWTASALFAVLALTHACRRIDDVERRRPWAYLLAACWCWLAGQVAWDVLMATGVALPFPSLPDLGWLLFAPVALAGVYRLTPASVGARTISALDALAVAVVTGAVVGVLHYDNASRSELSDVGTAIALAYAVLHSAVAATVVQSLCTRLSLLRRPDLALLSAGLLTQALAFTLWAGKLLDGSYRPGQEPLDLLWTLGMVAIGAGALRAVGAEPVGATTEHDIRLRGFLPALATVALTLLLIDLLITGAPLGERLVLRGAVVALLVVFSVRHWFVSAEHVRLVRSERRATERADRFFQLAPEMFSITGPDGGFVRTNARFAEVLGYSEEELLTQSALDLVHPDDRERTIEEMTTRLADGGLALAFENRFRRRDGTYAWMLWNARQDPVSGLVYAAAQDVTERRLGEEALRESEQRFTELVTTIPEVFFIAHADLAGTIYVSPAYESIWGRSCQSLLDDPLSWVEAIHEDDRERVLEGVGRANVEGHVEHEFRIVRPDGEVRLVHELVTVVRDEHGRPARHVGIGSDVTERRELEQQLQHARKLDAVGQLAGGVAHDFNNILTGIAGYTELALDRGEALDDGLRRDLEEVLRGARRASDLTRQLLTFARREVVRPQVVDVNDVIDGVSRFLRGTLREDVLVVTELAPALPRVKVDPHQLEQVLMNLVLNAGDAMPEGGVLTVATRPSPGEVTLLVSDTGTGMTEQTRSRIFEPFFTTKEVGKGTGLGLATVYGIVEDCGGRIAVESSPGAGSRFAVTLPATHEPADPGSPISEAPQLGGNERILLVEDDELVRRLTCEMLEREGYTVRAAASPEEALEYTADWDLLLTDVVMPVLSGPELAARLAVERGPLRVLFTSGYSGDTMVERGTLDPSVPLLEKPFSRSELAAAVRDALDAPSPRYGTHVSPAVIQPTTA